MKGFTLVEVLVAIALMALMAVLCWRGVDYVAAQRAEVEREAGEIERVVRTFAQLERDLAERLPDTALPAPSRSLAAAAELPLALAIAPAGGSAEVEIVRFVPQPDGPARALRVLYRVDAGGLVRSTRPLEAPRGAGAGLTLLPQAATMRVRVHSGGFWVQPGSEAAVQPPVRASALEITIEERSGARYIKVLAL